jgi:hypothetical protein
MSEHWDLAYPRTTFSRNCRETGRASGHSRLDRGTERGEAALPLSASVTSVDTQSWFRVSPDRPTSRRRSPTTFRRRRGCSQRARHESRRGFMRSQEPTCTATTASPAGVSTAWTSPSGSNARTTSTPKSTSIAISRRAGVMVEKHVVTVGAQAWLRPEESRHLVERRPPSHAADRDLTPDGGKPHCGNSANGNGETHAPRLA